MIGEGWGLSELTTHVQDSWGLSGAQARRYVKDAHVEFVNDYEVEDIRIVNSPAAAGLISIHLRGDGLSFRIR